MNKALRSIRLGHSTTTATTGMIGMLFLVLLNAAAHAGPAEVDDGWRRTRFGWENIKNWDLTPAQRELPSAAPLSPAIQSPSAETVSKLLHPCILAVGLSLLAIAALHFSAALEQARSGSVSIDV
jgi:hypothetical protein